LPLEYLPKKKKIKLEVSGKRKLPSVGTSDAWWDLAIEKDEQKKMKLEKAAKKKILQEKKKELAKEKKKLQQKINELQKEIKSEVL